MEQVSVARHIPRPMGGGVVALPKLSGPSIAGNDESCRAVARIPPPLPKHSSLEEYVFKASNMLLSTPGCANLIWCIADSEADYRRLRPGEFYNHFQNNNVLTTKSGLADNLLHHAVGSGCNVDAFFPRCYDVGRGKTEREEFLLDFRRSAALKVVLQHLQSEKAQNSTLPYECNLDVLRTAKQTLQRWCKDLDATHLDEEEDDCLEASRHSEEEWDALVLYSDFQESQLLCVEELPAGLAQRPRKRFSRIGGGDWGEDDMRDQMANETSTRRPADVHSWFEFRRHRWGSAPVEWRLILEELTAQLQKLYPQWSLQGGWTGRNVWIVKPGTNSKGSGVECMSTLPELLHHCGTMPNRIVQKYIERPLLLFSGRKFDIRQWVLVRSVSPLRIFLFSECYLRLCNDMYDLGDLRNRERHISNWQVNKNGKNVVDGAVASLAEFKDELNEITGSGSFWEDMLLPQLREIVLQTLRAVETKLVPRKDSFELYGFDVMIDEHMKMWLLEVNLSPGCDARTPFLDRLLSRMSKRLIEVAVLGQESPDGEHPDWVNICDDASERGLANIVETSQRLPCTADLTVHGQQMRIPKRSRPPASVVAVETLDMDAQTSGSQQCETQEEDSYEESFSSESLPPPEVSMALTAGEGNVAPGMTSAQSSLQSQPLLLQPCSPNCEVPQQESSESDTTSTAQSPRAIEEDYSDIEDDWDSDSDCSAHDAEP